MLKQNKNLSKVRIYLQEIRACLDKVNHNLTDEAKQQLFDDLKTRAKESIEKLPPEYLQH